MGNADTKQDILSIKERIESETRTRQKEIKEIKAKQNEHDLAIRKLQEFVHDHGEQMKVMYKNQIEITLLLSLSKANPGDDVTNKLLELLLKLNLGSEERVSAEEKKDTNCRTN